MNLREFVSYESAAYSLEAISILPEQALGNVREQSELQFYCVQITFHNK